MTSGMFVRWTDHSNSYNQCWKQGQINPTNICNLFPHMFQMWGNQMASAVSVNNEAQRPPSSGGMAGGIPASSCVVAGGGKTFSTLQGLSMAEDRRSKEREMNSFQNVSPVFSDFVWEWVVYLLAKYVRFYWKTVCFLIQERTIKIAKKNANNFILKISSSY